MNTKDKGDISEQRIILHLLESGHSVSEPVGDNQRYDLILDTGDSLKRLQVKTATKTDGGALKFNCNSAYLLSDGHTTNSYSENDIDAFAVYAPESEDIAYVPISDAPNTEMWLREEREDSRSNVLEDFQLDAVVE